MILSVVFFFLTLHLFAQHSQIDVNKAPSETYQLYYIDGTNGVTAKNPVTETLIPVGQAEPYYPALQKVKNNPVLFSETNWKLLDSVYLNSFIPASANLGVRMHTGLRKLQIISPFNLTWESQMAVKKSPRWLRAKLENTLGQLDATFQKMYADLINKADDPIIDEIAYSIAYTTPEFLASGFCQPNLFVENAQLIYAHDADLDYVEIVNNGDSKTDDNYYSTIKYWKINSDSVKVQIEVPKEIYYMYLVHPKLTDEYESYIDPTLVEHTGSDNSHLANIAEPPTGVFWRDYLYNVTEKKPDTTGENYKILKEEVKKCKVLWDEKNAEPQAVRAITGWIKNVMNFDSKSERPHQPARIYKLHLGRCGEHEDITAAAARACLIPCRGIDAYSSDHVWNEFWDEKWWQWEPVNNSHKDNLCYEKGWGKKFGSITSRRSDGVVEPATNTYSEHPCTILVYAYDSNSKPIDGATVYLAVQGTLDQSSIFIDTYATTDNEGKASFIVSAGRNYFARMITSLGNVPSASNQVVPLVNSPTEGQQYSYILKAPRAKTVKVPSVQPFPTVSEDQYLLRVNFNIESQATKWRVLFNDFPDGYTTFETTGGKANFYIADENNYNLEKTNTDYSVVESKTDLNTYTGEYKFNRWQVYYAWLKNLACMSNSVHATASFSLYSSPAFDVDNVSEDIDNSLLLSYPNPCAGQTNISFKLINPANIRLDIFDAQGRIIANISDGFYDAGIYSVAWNGLNISGSPVPNGIYYYCLDSGTEKLVRKLVVIR